ncbi:HNH endonuclease [Xenorhabdus bovienii]|uniref:HNH endonuclease signature motif containing protein n=1 Tax=Xenorhabdus bovienii TaxID=40576 RepID=UPI0023B23D65|nr:HNH endonuclease signature motif containing protein [Xenorhabdus bovienii]MDE9557097.1 HNH endonuclease [Xenorhabdus bovienii]
MIPEIVSARILVNCARHCSLCRQFVPLYIQVHHIVEQCNGGTHEEDNLIPVCANCHATIHTRMGMTKNFSERELKGHRDRVYEMVEKGQLPIKNQVTTGELQSISEAIVEALKYQKQEVKLSNIAIKLLLSAVSNSSIINIDRVGNHFYLATDDIILSSQVTKENMQYPDVILELIEKEYIALTGNTAEITIHGITYIQSIIETTSKYIEKKIKCLKCGLHFSIYSWHDELHKAETLHCPECGQSDNAFIIWAQRKYGFISQKVPGNATIWDSGNQK